MTALLQRHHRLIGVQVVRPGHDDYVGLVSREELGIVAPGDGLRVQLFHSVQLCLLGVDDTRDLSASVGCGHLCHTASGAAAPAGSEICTCSYLFRPLYLRVRGGNVVGLKEVDITFVVLESGHPDLFDSTVGHLVERCVTGVMRFAVRVVAGGVVAADQ